MIPSLLLNESGRFPMWRRLGLPRFYIEYLNSEHFCFRHGRASRSSTGTPVTTYQWNRHPDRPRFPPPLNEQQRRLASQLDALPEPERSPLRASLDAVPALLEQKAAAVDRREAAGRGDLTRDFREQHKDLEPATPFLMDYHSSPAEKDKKRLTGIRVGQQTGIDEAWGEIPATWQWVRVANLGAGAWGAVKPVDVDEIQRVHR